MSELSFVYLMYFLYIQIHKQAPATEIAIPPMLKLDV
jgi:hypothetical protein